MISGLVFMAYPVLGAIVGAAALIWGIVAIAKGHVSPIQLIFRESSKKTLMAVGSAFIGVFFVTCSGMGFNLAAEKEARQAQAAEHEAAAEEKRRAELAERQKRALESVARAKEALANGDVDAAQKLLGEARELTPDVEGADEVGQAVKDELHRRALATMPSRLEKIRSAAAKEEWEAAGTECRSAAAIDPDYEGLTASCTPVDHQLVLLSRKQAVDNALSVSSDPEKCDTPLQISDAWKALQKIPTDDPNFKKAKRVAVKLEKCRKKTKRAFDKGLREIMKSQRETYVDNLDTAMLKSGIDAVVTANGKYKDKLKIRWALMGRSMAHQLATDGGILTAAEKIGFKRVTFSDGFYESFYYDLEPQSEANGGQAVLEGMGLGEPLKL